MFNHNQIIWKTKNKNHWWRCFLSKFEKVIYFWNKNQNINDTTNAKIAQTI